MKRKIHVSLWVGFITCCNCCYALRPEKEYKYTPEQFGLEYRAIKIETIDNYKIYTWSFTPKVSAFNGKTIIVANGDAGNMSYGLYYVKQLIRLGYQVVTFDYRGFGASSDFDINNDFLFYPECCYDLNAVVEYVEKNMAKTGNLGIMAISMGTIITTLSYPKIKKSITFIIAENFVLDPYLVKNRLQKHKKKNILIPNEISRKNYQEQLERIAVPMLIFASKKDVVATLQDSHLIKGKISTTCSIVPYDDDHGHGLYALTRENVGDVYFEKIDEFLRGQ